jgi:hypothetical protein
MDPVLEQATARIDKMSFLAKTLAATSDPQAKKLVTQDLVLEAKQMVNEIQTPLDALMDQVVIVSTPLD